MKRKRQTISFFIVILFLSFGLLSCEQSTQAVGKTQVASSAQGLELAPDFTLTDIQGKRFSLSDTRGKLVVLNFWSVGCGVCKDEMPLLQELHEKYKDKGMEMVAVALDPPFVAQGYVADHGFTFQVPIGTRAVQAQYKNFRYIPRTFVINREGYIVDDIEGPRDPKYWQKVIEENL